MTAIEPAGCVGACHNAVRPAGRTGERVLVQIGAYARYAFAIAVCAIRACLDQLLAEQATVAPSRSIIDVLEQRFSEADALDRPLADKLVSYTGRARQVAPELLAAEDRLIIRLIAADAARKSPRCGAPMPAFALPDTTGAIIDLPSVLSTGPAVICINRGHWCPYDRLQLRDLARALPLLGDSRVGAVTIVPDTLPLAGRLASENQLPYYVLSDADLGYTLLLGLATWCGGELIDEMRRLGVDSAITSAIPARLLPMPATFVVDQAGTILASWSGPDFRQRMALTDIENALQRQARTSWTSTVSNRCN